MAVVRRLVAESPDPLGFLLTGGPGGASYLDADGEAYHLWIGFSGEDDVIARVEDGPRKVILIAIAAERVPELVDWLPKRPSDATTCMLCKGSCRIPQAPMCQCFECAGLGWTSPTMPIPDRDKPAAKS